MKFFKILLILSCLYINGMAQVWTGNVSSNVSTSGNWNGVPGVNSNLMFQNSNITTVNFDWPNAISSVSDITFNSGASNYTFNSSTNQYLTLNNIYNNQNSSIETFNVNLWFKNNPNVRTNGTIVFNNDIQLQTGNANINFDGSGEIVFGSNATIDTDANLTLMNGVDVDLGGANLSFDSLTITGPSIIDFAGQSEISINDLNFLGGGSLTILNWTINDMFLVQSTISPQDLPKIIFDGFGSSNQWSGGFVSPNNPVPEPSSYGLISFGCIGIFIFSRKHLTRRRR